MTDHDHDSELVALIDNELEGDTRARLLARLAEDEAMRKRYDTLREAGRLMVIALDALLQEAPLPQLRACLPPGHRRAPSARFAGIVLRGLAAGMAVCLLAAGAGAWIEMHGPVPKSGMGHSLHVGATTASGLAHTPNSRCHASPRNTTAVPR